MTKGMNLSVYFQKRLGSGLFGGEGFIMQKISGNGTVFIEIDGHCKPFNLRAGESILVDTGCLAAMTPSCSMSVEMVKGIGNVLFGGEGIFNTKITGPGTVYLQSMPIANTAAAIRPHLNIQQNNNRGN